MAWLRLTLEVAAPQVEAVIEFLEQFNAASVSLRPASGEPLFAGVGEEPELWHNTYVSALVDAGTDMDILTVCLRNRIGDGNIISLRVDQLQDRDWLEAYRGSVTPLVVADRLYIRPSWSAPESEYEHCIILDPGLAFGSGSHATTRLCLEWLAGSDLTGSVVIDYGCGSGILALAAARLGARRVYAVDKDPQALKAARQNIRVNGLADVITVLASSDAIPPPPADILVANILLKPLLDLAGLFVTLVADRGRIVLSGILSTQVHECLDTYGRWFKMDTPRYRDEWALIYGRR